MFTVCDTARCCRTPQMWELDAEELGDIETSNTKIRKDSVT